MANYKQEQVKPYSDAEEKGGQVERMFDNIASSYDTLNHRMSWNIDKWWRRKAIARLRPYSPQSILDVATGTGDFALQAARDLRPQQLLGTDISEGMMQVGKEKAKEASLDGIISFKREDCMQMTLDTGSFDAVTSAFGIRNFPDLDKGLKEMCRVLKPGGHLCVLELSAPQRFPMKQLFHVYSHTVMPFLGRLISKDGKAYDYLTRSIEAFPQGETVVQALLKAGFKEASFTRLTFGICTLYFGTK